MYICVAGNINGEKNPYSSPLVFRLWKIMQRTTQSQIVEACKRKKARYSKPAEQRRPRDFYWIIEDMAAIQQRNDLEEAMIIVAEKISTNKMELVLEDAGEALQRERKRKRPYEQTGEIPATFCLPQRVHSTKSLK